MKTQSRKLKLDRETLVPLQSDEMHLVNGGLSPLPTSLPTSTVTVTTTTTTVTVTRSVVSFAGGEK